jgi:hypothetical protein
MSYNPLKIRQIKKIKPLSFDEDHFFTQLSMESGGLDKDTVKRVYFGMVKHISKSLAKDGVIRAPHMGDFTLLRRKESVMFSGVGQRTLAEPITLKFFANELWKKHFSTLSIWKQ